MERGASFQALTDSFIKANNIAICGNDYTATASFGIRNLFAPPNATNGDPRPVFVAVNGVSNSPSHAQWQVLISDFSNGGGAFDFTRIITNSYRTILDSVQASPPPLANPRLTNGAFEFSFPGQRGRTNRVESTTNFVDWTTVTNVFGTNAPILFRDPNPAQDERRLYRIRRL